MTSADALHVLAVDDNSSLLRFLVSAFTASGCAVTAAPTAEEALDRIETDAFDLVVSDIKMPGLSGLDLLRAVKAKQPATPVVLITGAPSVNSAVFGLRHGAYDYLPKPFSIKEVQGLVERVRADRAKWNGQAPLPSGLAEELHRREAGVEMLLRVGDLALQGLAPQAFLLQTLHLATESLRNDGGLLLLRDEHGHFTSAQSGAPPVVSELLGLLQLGFDRVVATGGREAVALTRQGHRLDVVAAAIPSVDRCMGVVCLARLSMNGGFLPDERDMLLGFAQTTAVALQKLVLRENLERHLIDTITAFVNAIESKDPYLKGHSARVALYATEIATAMGLDDETIQVVSRGAMLHDLGKLSIMDTILRKPDRLTAEEFALIKAHPVVGERILKPLRFLHREACCVRSHHERFDGSGYPDGLKGEDIPLAARIVHVADALDSMLTTRIYRAARPALEAMDELQRAAGSQFCPRCVGALERVLPPEILTNEAARHELLAAS